VRTFTRVPAWSGWLPHLWRAGAAVALLVLLAQIVNHYRDQLAATARLHRPLTRLYASLGVPLVPRWDLRAYEVRQLGASVEPTSAGVITVRASIKNAARNLSLAAAAGHAAGSLRNRIARA